MKLIIIAARALNNVIGDSQKGLPWHVPEEFRHFKSTTLGYPVIMGNTTFKELGKPLPKRTNIVVSRSPHPENDSVLYCTTLEAAIAQAADLATERVFIIGGASIYKQALPVATEMILTTMKFEAEGDVYFPEFPTDEWNEVDKKDYEQFVVHYYTRKEN